MRHFLNGLGALAMMLLLFSCSVSRHTVGRAAKTLLQDSALQQAHIGISIYDVGKGQYLYNYQGDKYFIPASNTKLFTCYAGMKYLGDSLLGMRCGFARKKTAKEQVLCLQPTGDPTFRHEDFKNDPVFKLLQDSINQYDAISIYDTSWQDNALGYGWAWDDYNDDYMAERSAMPIFGNLVNIKPRSITERDNDIKIYNRNAENRPGPPITRPEINYLKATPDYFDAFLNKDAWLLSSFMLDGNSKSIEPKLQIKRGRSTNDFNFSAAENKFVATTIPFATINNAEQRYLPGGNFVAAEILCKMLRKKQVAMAWVDEIRHQAGIYASDGSVHPTIYDFSGWKAIKSQPTDSMLKPMMHRSDNFYAEQTLLMVSQQQLGYMKTGDIIDTLLKTDLKDLPQRPKWVDGSGLSRYNLATPQSFVHLLQKMKTEFGMARLKNVLATGGEGTIRSYYQPLKGFIFAKTGTLSNNCALSGYLLTKSGNWLIFSVLANNYPSGATPVRRAVERFLTAIQQQY